MPAGQNNFRIVITGDPRPANRAIRSVNRNMRTVGTSAERIRRQVGNAFAFIAIGAGIARLVNLVDQFTVLQNRIRVVTTSTAGLNVVTEELFRIANKTWASFRTTADVYARASLSANKLGFSQRQILDFTEALNIAVILSGATTKEARNGLIQLSQGLASNTLRGDELRSVMEQLIVVAESLAKHLGVTRGELRKLASQHVLTAGTVVEALLADLDDLRTRFGRTLRPIGAAFEVFTNKLIAASGSIDRLISGSINIGRALDYLGDNIEEIVRLVTGLIGGFVGLVAIKVSARIAAYALNTAIVLLTASLRALLLLVSGKIVRFLLAIAGGLAALLTPIGAIAAGIVVLTGVVLTFSDRIQYRGTTSLDNFRSGLDRTARSVKNSTLAQEIRGLSRDVASGFADGLSSLGRLARGPFADVPGPELGGNVSDLLGAGNLNSFNNDLDLAVIDPGTLLIDYIKSIDYVGIGRAVGNVLQNRKQEFFQTVFSNSQTGRIFNTGKGLFDDLVASTNTVPTISTNFGEATAAVVEFADRTRVAKTSAIEDIKALQQVNVESADIVAIQAAQLTKVVDDSFAAINAQPALSDALAIYFSDLQTVAAPAINAMSAATSNIYNTFANLNWEGIIISQLRGLRGLYEVAVNLRNRTRALLNIDDVGDNRTVAQAYEEGRQIAEAYGRGVGDRAGLRAILREEQGVLDAAANDQAREGLDLIQEATAGAGANQTIGGVSFEQLIAREQRRLEQQRTRLRVVEAEEDSYRIIEGIENRLSNKDGFLERYKNEGYEEIFKNFAEDTRRWAEALEFVDNVGNAIFDGLSNAFAEFVDGGKVSFRDLVNSISRDLSKIAFEAAITDPLKEAFGTFIRGGGAIGSRRPGLGGGGPTASSNFIGTPLGGPGNFLTRLFGANNGASFYLGGNSGVDNNVLSLNGAPFARVSSNERLDVVRPQDARRQNGGSSGDTIVYDVKFNIQGNNADQIGQSVEQRLRTFTAQQDQLRSAGS